MDKETKEKGLRFDGTINAGHVITFVAFLVSGAAAWVSVDKRVVVLEEQSKAQFTRDAQQDVVVKDARERLERAQERTDAKLDRIIDKLENFKR